VANSKVKINPRFFRDLQRQAEREAAKYPIRVPVQGQVTDGGGVGPGVPGSEVELVAGWFVDWLFEYAKRHPSTVEGIAGVMDKVGAPDGLRPMVEEHIDVAADLLVEAGLVRVFASFGGKANRSLQLTESGTIEASARIQRRRDNRTRRLTCRGAVLRWVYERQADGETTEITEIVNSPYGWYNGIPFTEGDLSAAIAHLRQQKLLAGSDDAPVLEQAGVDCIENYGDLVTYSNRRDNGGVNVTITGNVNGQLAVANRDVDMSQSTQNDAQVLTVFAEALREIARLVPEQAAEFEHVASGLDAEAAKETQDATWVKSLVERAKGLLDQAEGIQGIAQMVKVAFDVYSAAQLGS
jgi:hypothetical protein